MSKPSSGSSTGDVFIGSTAYPGKPKGLLDALSEIQQYYVVERTGSTIPEDFLTFSGKLAFFEVGAKGAVVSGLISAMLTPIAVGVIERYIPIFGSYEPSFFDKFFAFILAMSFSLGYGIFIATVGKYYIGGISRAAIRNLMGGLIVGALVKLIIVFILFHFIYFVVLDPTRVASFLIRFRASGVKYEVLDSIYRFLMDFRPVFLTSAYFVVFTTILLIAIPAVSIFVGSRRTKRAMQQEEMWK